MSQMDGRVPLYQDPKSPLPMGADAATNGSAAGIKMTEAQINDGNIIERQVQISNKTGLHARPAMQFVDIANKYASRITVCKSHQCVNAKSIMELLLLAAGAGTVLTIRAEGLDAAEAVDALIKLVESKFGED
jgi:phosphocarrier protein HPr